MRPAVANAKLERIAEVLADIQDLKAMAKSNRPSQASIDEVRAAGAASTKEVIASGGSVAAIEQTELPTERLS